METKFPHAASFLVVVALSVTTAAITTAVTSSVTARPVFTPSTTRVVVHPTPDVLRSVQGLARLESVTYHMEKVIDLREEQSHLFGMVRADDAIVLVAVGEVIAGVDLSELRPGDVRVDASARRATLTLPQPRVFFARLDSERTHVHSRSTDLLARRGVGLESRARQEAERSISAGALEAGILERARQGAGQTVSSLVRSLGFDTVELRWR